MTINKNKGKKMSADGQPHAIAVNKIYLICYSVSNVNFN